MNEPVFGPSPADLLPALAPGALVLTTIPAPDTLAEIENLHAAHRPGYPAETAIDAVRTDGVTAAAAHPGGGNCESILALRFAIHLSRCRMGDPRPVRPCATSPYRPELLPQGIVRIPHLVAVAGSSGIRDRTIWELMPQASARNWLGQALPGQAWFEDHLDDLLALRARLRRGGLPGHGAKRELSRLLDGRYLSIRFAYRHEQLLRNLVDRSGQERHG